jgi:hypothetical protein
LHAGAWIATFDGMAATMFVRRPTAAPAGDTIAPTYTVGRPLAGLTLGFREDRAWRSWQHIARNWAERLQREGARSVSIENGAQVGSPGSHDRKAVVELANATDGAFVGLGTCGSCTTFTIKDAVAVEEQGKPVVAMVCEEFIVHGRNVARHLGHADLKILVLPYPLEALPAEELDAIADEYYPKALELLGVQP